MLYKTHVFLVNRKCQISMTENQIQHHWGSHIIFAIYQVLQSLHKPLGQRFFGKKNAKNVMKNVHIETSYISLIMLLSIQPVKIPEKITVF